MFSQTVSSLFQCRPAYELNKTGDWVVIYYDRGEGEDQVTVVTEWNGPLAGKRIVRGREQERASYYEKVR